MMTENRTKRRAEDEIFGDDSLGKVRGILFGELARETSDRLDSLEEALMLAMRDLRADMDRHVATLTEQLGAETTERTKQEKLFRRDVDKKIDKVSATLSSSSDAAQELLAQTRVQLDEKIDLVSAELSDSKVDRSALASLFTTTASQLHPEGAKLAKSKS